MTVFVFTGPSLDHETARRVLPGARVLGPAKRGDLVRLGAAPGDIIVLIDGYYYQRCAVQHIEIIDALRSSIRVIGAASIGALRAAELASVGMRGTGWVYEQFRAGALCGDDEVAVTHDPDQYVCTSDALVTLRYNLERAARAGVIRPALQEHIVSELAQRWFGERSFAAAVALARAAEGPATANRLREYFRDDLVDIKRRDAIGALESVALNAEALASEVLPLTSFALSLRREYTAPAADEGISDDAVLAYSQIREPDMPALYRRCALFELRRLVETEGGVPRPRGAMLQTIAAARGVDPEDLSRRLRGGPLSLDDALDAWAWERAWAQQDGGDEPGALRACHAGLVRAGHIDARASLMTVERFLYPVLESPGAPALGRLTLELQLRGSLRAARRRLSAVRRGPLHALSDQDIRHATAAPEGAIADLCALRWCVPRERFDVEARARGFGSSRPFFATAGKFLIVRTLQEEVLGVPHHRAPSNEHLHGAHP